MIFLRPFACELKNYIKAPINCKCIQVELIMWCYLTFRFHYMAIADDRQRLMPAPEDLLADRSVQLAYPEARRLTNPIEPALQGEVCVQCFYNISCTI